MIIDIHLSESSYPIVVERGVLNSLSSHFDVTSHKVLIVTDTNIPKSYADSIVRQCSDARVLVIPAGEESKNIDNFLKIQEMLLTNAFSRKDVVIALGGGVIGDLTAFAASTYKRGLSFINVPTSSLAMIDSSIGGKTAIDFMGVKNCIGTFYQPKLVLIDFDLLSSLPERQLNNGLVEALKAGYIHDSSILELFHGDLKENLEDIITRSILVKKWYVEQDEKEQNVRKILNYGHTFGHGLESFYGFGDSLYHGEAVAIGMLLVSENKEEVLSFIHKLGIHLPYPYDSEKVLRFIRNDKKANKDTIDLILTKNGEGIIKTVKMDDLKDYLERSESYVRRIG